LPGRTFALGIRKVSPVIEKMVCQLTDLFPRVKSVRVETMTAESTNYSLPAGKRNVRRRLSDKASAPVFRTIISFKLPSPCGRG
jgi:hypothetical protein